MTRFALRHIPTQELLGFYTTPNNGAPCACWEAYELDDRPGNGSLWLVETREEAETVRTRRGEWFSAGYLSPLNPFRPSELEVVQIELTVTR